MLFLKNFDALVIRKVKFVSKLVRVFFLLFWVQGAIHQRRILYILYANYLLYFYGLLYTEEYLRLNPAQFLLTTLTESRLSVSVEKDISQTRLHPLQKQLPILIIGAVTGNLRSTRKNTFLNI